jgi:hypothetical protein
MEIIQMSLESSILVKKSNSNKDNNSSKQHCHFAFCTTCFWTATILRIKQKVNSSNNYNGMNIISCPVCCDYKISLVPLVLY